MTVGPRPDPPSVVVSVPSGYDEPAGTLQVEVSDPHRVGEGMSKHVEYKVTYWTDLANYGARSGCVTRRYSDFEWLWKQLRSTMDGVIVPALPQKTLVPNDDPTSAAIERRRATLALFIARVAAHPVMRASSDLQIFLEEEDKAAWSTRVPWYERGVTSDALRGVSDWFQNTVRLDDTGTAANLIAGAQDAAVAAAAAARNAASGAAPAPVPAANALPGVTPEGTVTLPPIVTGAAVAAPPGVMLPPSPQHAGPNASAPSDGIVETQHFLEVADYVSKLKQRVDKLHLATSALVKHSQHTSTTLMQFAATVTELEEAETKAIAAFARGAATETGSDRKPPDPRRRRRRRRRRSTLRVEWTRAATLFASTSAPPAAHAEAVTAVFLEPLEAAGRCARRAGTRATRGRRLSSTTTACADRSNAWTPRRRRWASPNRDPNARRNKRWSSRRAIFESRARRRCRGTSCARIGWSENSSGFTPNSRGAGRGAQGSRRRAGSRRGTRRARVRGTLRRRQGDARGPTLGVRRGGRVGSDGARAREERNDRDGRGIARMSRGADDGMTHASLLVHAHLHLHLARLTLRSSLPLCFAHSPLNSSTHRLEVPVDGALVHGHDVASVVLQQLRAEERLRDAHRRVGLPLA